MDEDSQAAIEAAYVRFDERQDVLASLDLLKLLTPLLEQEPWYWKWVIIAADNAVQGAIVCALADSTNTSILTRKSRIAMLNWLDDRSEERPDPPKERLADFGELFDACLTELGLPLTGEETKSIRKLHDALRNQFAHFTPKGWLISKSYMPQKIAAALKAVELLMAVDKVVIHLDLDQQRRLTDALSSIRANLPLVQATE